MNVKRKVMILGGNSDQKKLVEEFNNRGFYTIIIDYYENPPAKKTANKHYQISTYDRDAILKIAKEEKVEFVTTISTDQPILIAAYVSEKLGLKFHISYEQALNITNKKYMKNVLRKNNISTADFVILENAESLSLVNQLKFPVIIKPVDSSGSRGVFVVNDIESLQKYYYKSVSFSRTNTVIAEEFIEGQEISVDCVVKNSEANVIAISDGYKVMIDNKIPLYNQNIYPSKISDVAKDKVQKICSDIAISFMLQNTPLFVQMIVSNNDVYVIEFSARIAGGSKPYFIPLVSGFDIVSSYVSQLLDESINIKIVSSEDYHLLNHIYSSGGIFQDFEGVNDLLKSKQIENFIIYQEPGSQVRMAKNGSDRIGAFIVRGETFYEAINKVVYIDSNVRALDDNQKDIMLHNLFKMKTHTFLQKLSEFYSNLSIQNIHSAIIEKAKLSLLDYLFVYVAGFQSGVLKDAIMNYVFDRTKNEDSTILLSAKKADVEYTTLVSALITHSVELDDGHRYGTAHPAVVVIPAALAIAEKEKASFNDLIKAIIIGYDFMLRLSKSINPSHLKRGFHSTSTTGTIGAAAAAAAILKFDAKDFANAVSIAGLLSSGLQEMLHSNPSIKAFQVGRSSQSGVLATQFVTYGGKGPASIFEGQHGWIKAMSDQFDQFALLNELGERWEIMNTYTKLYPTCRHCHHAIDLAIQAFREGNTIDKIEKVKIKTYTVGIAEVGIIKRPTNIEDAMFSLTYSTSIAFMKGFVTLEYLNEFLLSANLLSFSEKIVIEPDDEMDAIYPSERGCTMELVTKTGEKLYYRTNLAKGEPETPLSNEEYLTKFKEITKGVFHPIFVDEIFNIVMSYPDKPGFIEDINTYFIEGVIKK